MLVHCLFGIVVCLSSIILVLMQQWSVGLGREFVGGDLLEMSQLFIGNSLLSSFLANPFLFFARIVQMI